MAKSIAQTYDAKLLVSHVPVVLAGPPHAVDVAQESADRTKAALQQKVEDLKRDGVTAEFALPEMTTHGVAHTIAEFAGLSAKVGRCAHAPAAGVAGPAGAAWTASHAARTAAANRPGASMNTS